jgi:DNA-binding GntR family transcriptional regulator
VPVASYAPIVKERTTAYARVAAHLRDAMQRGTYAAGALLPTQHELARDFGVSRITIVRALQELEAQGLVDRRQGVGTFVARRDSRLVLTNASQLYKQTFPDDGHPHHALLSVTELEDPTEFGHGVMADAGPCWHVVRLRQRGGRTLSFEETLVPRDVVPEGVRPHRLEHVLVHDFLTRDCAVVLESTRVHVAATTLDPDRAAALERPAFEPGLLITRVNLAVGGRPVSFSLNVLPADVSEYFFEFRHSSGEGGSGP